MSKPKVLFVDDDPNILNGYRRTLRKQYDITTTESPEEAFSMLEHQGPFAVVVSDYRMPQMDGVQFLTASKEYSPKTVRVILTGQADMNAAVTAINDGNIFQFVSKPCPSDQLEKILDHCIAQFHLVTAEERILAESLKESSRLLVELLCRVNPLAFTQATRLEHYTRAVITDLRLENTWVFELSALLSQMGCVNVPSDILQKLFLRESFTEEEQTIYNRHPRVGAEFLSTIPQLSDVSAIIRNQFEPISSFLNRNIPLAEQSDVAVGSMILRTVVDFDKLRNQSFSSAAAISKMLKQSSEYDAHLLKVLGETEINADQQKSLNLHVNELGHGMTFVGEVKTTSGLVVVPDGQQVTRSLIERLRTFSKQDMIKEPIAVSIHY